MTRITYNKKDISVRFTEYAARTKPEPFVTTETGKGYFDVEISVTIAFRHMANLIHDLERESLIVFDNLPNVKDEGELRETISYLESTKTNLVTLKGLFDLHIIQSIPKKYRYEYDYVILPDFKVVFKKRV